MVRQGLMGRRFTLVGRSNGLAPSRLRRGRRAYDFFAIQEFGRNYKRLNFPQDAHRAHVFLPAEARHITMAWEKEHHRAQQQMARRSARPEDDPLVRHLMQQPEVMAYQQQVFGPPPTVSASHDVAAGTEEEDWTEEQCDQFWDQVDREMEQEEAEKRRSTRPVDDPLVRELMDVSEVMAYQQQYFGAQGGAGPSSRS